MAKCHPTPLTHHRKEGEKIPPPHQLGKAGSKKHPKTEECGEMMGGPQNSPHCSGPTFPAPSSHFYNFLCLSF